jgi:hypothetical protein
MTLASAEKSNHTWPERNLTTPVVQQWMQEGLWE